MAGRWDCEYFSAIAPVSDEDWDEELMDFAITSATHHRKLTHSSLAIVGVTDERIIARAKISAAALMGTPRKAEEHGGERWHHEVATLLNVSPRTVERADASL